MLRRSFLALPAVALAQSQELDLGGVEERHVWVAMRDGTELSTWLYIPPGEGPWPVIYEQRYAPIRAEGRALDLANGHGAPPPLPQWV